MDGFPFEGEDGLGKRLGVGTFAGRFVEDVRQPAPEAFILHTHGLPVRADRDYRPGLAIFVMKQFRAPQHPTHQLICQRLLGRRSPRSLVALGLHEGLRFGA